MSLVSTISLQNVMISRTLVTTMTVSWTKLTLIEARGFINKMLMIALDPCAHGVWLSKELNQTLSVYLRRTEN